MSEENPTPKSQSEADEVRPEGFPGKVPGEGSGPTEAGKTTGGDDVDSAAVGDGPSGGAPADNSGSNADASAVGDGPSGGAVGDNGDGASGGSAEGSGPRGGAPA